jgi:hypothetical protein
MRGSATFWQTAFWQTEAVFAHGAVERVVHALAGDVADFDGRKP